MRTSLLPEKRGAKRGISRDGWFSKKYFFSLASSKEASVLISASLFSVRTGEERRARESLEKMGQYWGMINLDRREILNTHAFGAGCKYVQQWFEGPLYSAMMVLLTDMTSLGKGLGDFRLHKMPDLLRQLVVPVIGSWAGNRLVFAGDYTEVKEYKLWDSDDEDDEDDEGKFKDISDQTALAVWTMVAFDLLQEVKGTEDETAETLKRSLFSFLEEEVCKDKPWFKLSEDHPNLKPLLAKIEELLSKEPDPAESKRARSVEESGGEDLPNKKRARSESEANDPPLPAVSSERTG